MFSEKILTPIGEEYVDFWMDEFHAIHENNDLSKIIVTDYYGSKWTAHFEIDLDNKTFIPVVQLDGRLFHTQLEAWMVAFEYLKKQGLNFPDHPCQFYHTGDENDYYTYNVPAKGW